MARLEHVDARSLLRPLDSPFPRPYHSPQPEVLARRFRGGSTLRRELLLIVLAALLPFFLLSGWEAYERFRTEQQRIEALAQRDARPIAADQVTAALRREALWAMSRLLVAGVPVGAALWLLARRLTTPTRELAAAVERQVSELQDAHERERSAAEHALAELRRLHSEFVAVAAHELRTPVAAAKSYAELLLREDESVEMDGVSRRQALERLNTVCDRLSRLVRSLLGASRIQTGTLEVARVPFDVAAVTRRIAAEIGGATASHDVMLGEGLDRSLVAVGDPERIEDVLVNLLANAIKYSPPGSVVLVDVRRTGDMVEVMVEDDGPGVSEDERELVFERFARGSRASATSAAPGGVGLGLYIARAYVEAMGGSIAVRQRSGGGAAFWFTIPTRAEAVGRAVA